MFKNLNAETGLSIEKGCRQFLEVSFFMSSLTFNLLSYNRQLRKTNQGNEWSYLH